MAFILQLNLDIHTKQCSVCLAECVALCAYKWQMMELTCWGVYKMSKGINTLATIFLLHTQRKIWC